MYFIKYRPAKIADVVGQDEACRAVEFFLRRVMNAGDPRGSILLTGPSGSGKTTLAHCVARVLCKEPFIHSICVLDSRNCGITELKDAERFMQLMPPSGRWKVYIVDECHSISKAGQDFMLGLLERMPPWRIVIGTSTEHKPFDDILMSRWAHIRLNLLDFEACKAHIQRLAEAEGIELPHSDHVVRPFFEARSFNLRRIVTDLFDLGLSF